MKNKSITSRSLRPQRSAHTLNKRRPPSQNKFKNNHVTIPHMKWKNNYSSGRGILPKSSENDINYRNKENDIVKDYRSNSRARYQKSMEGSGIADLIKNNTNDFDQFKLKVEY